jgi:hypothetical protein
MTSLSVSDLASIVSKLGEGAEEAIDQLRTRREQAMRAVRATVLAAPMNEIAATTWRAVADATTRMDHEVGILDEASKLLELVRADDRRATPPALVTAFSDLAVAPEPDPPADGVYVPLKLTMPKEIGAETPIQGPIGNCYFVAALCAAAHRAPQLLRGAARVQQGMVVVTLGRRQLVVKQTLPINGALELAGARSSDGTTLIPYLEKAFAVDKGRYGEIDKGGRPMDALEWITGVPAEEKATHKLGRNKLHRLLASPDLLVVASSRTLSDVEPHSPEFKEWLAGRYEELKILETHAYTVLGVQDGHVTLHNPSALTRPARIPQNMFMPLFFRVSWCGIPKPHDSATQSHASGGDGP